MKKLDEYRIYKSNSYNNEDLDVLCIGPHPDDVELFCGGSVASYTGSGLRVGVADLSQGEMASNGDIKTRQDESREASKVLSLTVRYNLELPDSFIKPGDEEQRDRIVSLIRNTKPKILILPFGDSRHPDHHNTRKLCDEALFFSNLAKYKPELGSRCTVHTTIYYMLRTKFEPSFVVDISKVKDKKHQAIMCHKSQVISQDSGNKTLVSDPMSISSIKARDTFYGSQVGVECAEPFFVTSPLLVSDPYNYFTQGEVQKSFLRNS